MVGIGVGVVVGATVVDGVEAVGGTDVCVVEVGGTVVVVGVGSCSRSSAQETATSRRPAMRATGACLARRTLPMLPSNGHRRRAVDRSGELRDLGRMPKANDQVDSRTALLDAAVDELAARGWGGLRTRTVAERAGVNKGLVHYHFGSMDDLRLEAVAHVLTHAVADAATALVNAPSVAAGIRELCRHLGGFRADAPQAVVLMEAMLHAPREPRLQSMVLEVVAKYEAALTERIADDVASGALPEGTDAGALAVALTAVLDGLGLHAYLRPDVDFAAAGEAMATVFESTRR